MNPDQVVVGIDNGATKNNATVLDASGRFLVDRMYEIPSRVGDGPDAAIEAMAETMHLVLSETGTASERVAAVGLDTPGPAGAASSLAQNRPNPASPPTARIPSVMCGSIFPRNPPTIISGLRSSFTRTPCSGASTRCCATIPFV